MSIRTFIILVGVSIAMRIQARESDANASPNSHATQPAAITPVTIEAGGQKAVPSNGQTTLKFDSATGTYSATDLAKGKNVLADAGVCNTRENDFKLSLESDKYHGDSEQAWWDDAHWAEFGHMIAPYETMAKWCAAITSRSDATITAYKNTTSTSGKRSIPADNQVLDHQPINQ